MVSSVCGCWLVDFLWCNWCLWVFCGVIGVYGCFVVLGVGVYGLFASGCGYECLAVGMSVWQWVWVWVFWLILIYVDLVVGSGCELGCCH